MRLLSTVDQENILEQVRAVFNGSVQVNGGSSPFKFTDPSWARVISGQEVSPSACFHTVHEGFMCSHRRGFLVGSPQIT